MAASKVKTRSSNLAEDTALSFATQMDDYIKILQCLKKPFRKHFVLFDDRDQRRNTLDCKHKWMV